MPQHPVAMATGGGNRHSNTDEFEDFVSEINDIEQGRETEEKEEDDVSKTPDEGEQELAWLKDVGYSAFVSSIQEGKEINDDQLSSQTSSLTKAQSDAVKKRVDTLNATIRKKQKPHPKKDVRDLFTQEPDHTSGGVAQPNYKNVHVGHRSSHNRPVRRGSNKMRDGSILKNRGGYSMTGDVRVDKDSHSSTDFHDQLEGGSGEVATEPLSSIETLSIQTRETSRLLLPGMPQPSIPAGKEIAFNDTMDDIRRSPRLIRTRDVRSSMTELPNFVLTQEVLGLTRTEDLCEEDLNRIRSLALIELTTLFDCYNISYTRRKPGKRKQKEQGVYGVSLQTLLDHDRKLFPQLNLKVPFFYQQLLIYLENNSIKEEGILRVPGSALRTKQLRQEVEDKVNAGLFSWEDVRPNDAAGLLKQYLRELPSPLLTFEYLEAFAQVENIPDKKRLLQALNLLVLLLPDVHRESLMLLLHFLNLIVDHVENKMTLNNVAMIMAPNLFLVQSGSSRNKTLKELDFTLAAGTTNIVRMFIKYQDLLCTIPTYLLTQVRSQYEHEQMRKSRDKSIMKFLGRKDKSDVYKKPQIIREDDYNEQVIRVQTPHLSSPNTAIRLDDKMTANQILDRLQGPAPQHQSQSQSEESRQNVNGRDSSSNGNVQSHSQYGYILCEVGGNIGERKLAGDTNMLALYRVNPNAEWIIRKKQH